jgi:hypothetical protein
MCPLKNEQAPTDFRRCTRTHSAYGSNERVAEQAATLPETRLVYVTDREGDIAELMKRGQ